MRIPGKKVVLRKLEEEDFLKLVEWAQDEQVRFFSEGEYPSSLEECLIWHKKVKSDRYQEKLGIMVDDQLIGDLELNHITWRSGDAELRIRIGEKSLWNQGLGTDAVITLCHHGFFSLNLSRIYLRVYLDNYRAIRCYEKVGFKKEGKLQRTSDEKARSILLMRIFKEEFYRKNRDLSVAS